MYTVTLSRTLGVNTTTFCAVTLVLFPGRGHPIYKHFFLRREGRGTSTAGLSVKRHLSGYFMN